MMDERGEANEDDDDRDRGGSDMDISVRDGVGREGRRRRGRWVCG